MSISKVVLEYWSQEGQVMARVIDEKGYWVHVGASTLKDSNPTVEDAVKILFNKKKIWNYSEEKAILTKFFSSKEARNSTLFTQTWVRLDSCALMM